MEHGYARRRFIFVAVGAVGMLVLAIAYYTQIGRHDQALRSLEGRFATVHHPSGTVHVAAVQRLGLLVGNGNHCDYIVAECRSYAGDPSMLLKAYASQKIASPLDGSDVPVLVWICGSPTVASDGWEAPDEVVALGREHEGRLRGSTLYVVFVIVSGDSPGLDPRCT